MSWSRLTVVWRRVALAAALLGGLLVAGGAGASARAGNYPVLVVGAGPSADYVLVAEGCAALRCLVLDRYDPVTGRFTRVARPPLRAVRDSPSGDLARMVFASDRLGLALSGQSGDVQRVYVTGDGARSWHRVALGSGERALDVAAGGGTLYVVLARCHTARGLSRCHDYRLAHASAALDWTSVAVSPSVTTVPVWDHFGPQLGPVAAYGRRVVVVQLSGKTTPVRRSSDAGATWSTTRVAWPTLTNIDGCTLSPEGPTVLWATCPTGMQVSFYRSGDAGVTWKAVAQGQFSGTGSGFFAAASASVAYLDYGYPLRHALYVVRAPGLVPARVGPLPCASATSEAFSDVAHGALVCTATSSPYAAPHFVVTSDQGHNWREVPIP